MVNADTAADLSETTTASASGPSAAETADSQPLDIVNNADSRPRERIPLESTTPEPSRCTKLSWSARSLPSSPERLRPEIPSRSCSAANSCFAFSSALFADSKSESSPGSFESTDAI